MQEALYYLIEAGEQALQRSYFEQILHVFYDPAGELHREQSAATVMISAGRSFIIESKEENAHSLPLQDAPV